MSKLTKIQKDFLETIANKKARHNQKSHFKMQNDFDLKNIEVIFSIEVKGTSREG